MNNIYAKNFIQTLGRLELKYHIQIIMRNPTLIYIHFQTTSSILMGVILVEIYFQHTILLIYLGTVGLAYKFKNETEYLNKLIQV